MKLMCGNANRPLAKAIADYLDAPLSDVEIERFADGELFVRIDENMRGQDVFIIQPTSEPANDHLMELLICMDAGGGARAPRHPPPEKPPQYQFRLFPPGYQKPRPHPQHPQPGSQPYSRRPGAPGV
jgi:hypothetical protein